MVDWNVANNIFVSGVIVVMVVMFTLQVTVTVVSVLVRFFENRVVKQKD